ncbi:protoglobin domain-containing protein [Cytobacillus spongiae]|jgi:putative two-component system response regulator|uniref:protoglobin domain-containing protein n=1 Tax=Cytobacillus spongiae TaxID=2901381 RepID=UPI001F27A2C2|nr:protoglobin domain-containing protein [Cytobacillus spongiae]UII54323.1 protoglobin domain-containing protein [Cytobacillus spongiae]
MSRINVKSKERLKQIKFTGITEHKLKLISQYKESFSPSLESIVDQLYTDIYDVPEMRDIINDYSTINRLKVTQLKYLQSCLDGMIDDAYIESRLTIGRVHSRIGLDTQWYAATYSRYLDILKEIAKTIASEDVLELMNAFTSLFTFDLQLAIEAYNEKEIDKVAHPVFYEMEKLRVLNGFTNHDLLHLENFSGLLSFQVTTIMNHFKRIIRTHVDHLELPIINTRNEDEFHSYMKKVVLEFFQEKTFQKPEIFYRLIRDWSRLIIEDKLPEAFFQSCGMSLVESVRLTFLTKEHINDSTMMMQVNAFERLVKFGITLIHEMIRPYRFLQNFNIMNIYAYEISTTDFGQLTWMDDRMKQLLKKQNRQRFLKSQLGGRCYEVIFNRSLPCPGCPVAIKSSQPITVAMENEGKSQYYKIGQLPLNEVFELSRSLLVMQDTTKESKMMFDTIDRLLQLAEFRDDDTGQHVDRIGILSGMLAQLAGMDETFVNQIAIASKFHDVGKVGIPDNILNKPGKLTEDERESMKNHALIGYQILSNLELPVIQMAASIAHTHHEWYNGNGYPNGLKGEQIPLEGRIVAIVDVFDALLSKRVYKEPFPPQQVKEILLEGKGKQFDPKLVDLLLSMWDEFITIRKKVRMEPSF